MPLELNPVIAERARIFYGPRPILEVQEDGTLLLGPNGLFDGDGDPPLTDEQIETGRIFCAGLEELDDSRKLLPHFSQAFDANIQRITQNPLIAMSGTKHLFVKSWQDAANALARNHGEAEGLDRVIQRELSEGFNMVAGNLMMSDPEAAIKSPQTYTYRPHPTIIVSGLEVPKAVVKTPDWAIETVQRWFDVAKQVIAITAAPRGN